MSAITIRLSASDREVVEAAKALLECASRLDGKEDEIRRFLKLGVSKSAIAKITGVSRPTLDHFVSSRGLSPGA